MKIGVITSGIENLILCKPLLEAGHELVIFADQLHEPYRNHTSQDVLRWIDQAYRSLGEKGVERVILSPAWEIMLEFSGSYPLIAPVFRTYLFEQVLPYSLVGKIGILGGWSEISSDVQKVLRTVFSKYILNAYQSGLAKFHRDFPVRSQDTGLWMTRYASGYHMQECVNKMIKTDLRVFKDANIDTLIPLNYEILRYEKNITHFINPKKIRFHGKKALWKTLESMFGVRSVSTQVFQPVEVIVRGHLEHRHKHKQLMWLLSSGNKQPLKISLWNTK